MLATVKKNLLLRRTATAVKDPISELLMLPSSICKWHNETASRVQIPVQVGAKNKVMGSDGISEYNMFIHLPFTV